MLFLLIVSSVSGEFLLTADVFSKPWDMQITPLTQRYVSSALTLKDATFRNRLTDGGEVSLTRRPPFTPRKIPGTHFC
jgi:hypothetical protein